MFQPMWSTVIGGNKAQLPYSSRTFSGCSTFIVHEVTNEGPVAVCESNDTPLQVLQLALFVHVGGDFSASSLSFPLPLSVSSLASLVSLT